MRFLTRLLAVAGLAGLAFGTPAPLLAHPADPQTVELWPGPPPGTEDWTGAETTIELVPGRPEYTMLSNVTTPTLTVYRPDATRANGTAVIVIPGGGFQMLAMQHEGAMVARWLNEQGVTAIVLKYRVRQTPDFRMPTGLRANPERFDEFVATFGEGIPIAVADATQALRYVRAHASELGIAPDRVGMIGFSAGAITTMGVVLDNAPADRPNFAAPIYGAMQDRPVPADAPPLFIAVTQDDDAVPAVESIAIYQRWSEANLPAELHVYERGGHGFGMTPTGLPVSNWTTAFAAWMQAGGWLEPRETGE